MDLFAFRRPCPAKGGISGKQKKITLCALCDSAVNYYVLMKLRSSRVQDIADISRMLGGADEKTLQKTRKLIQSHSPEDSEDLESLISLGQLEMKTHYSSEDLQ